MLNPISTSALYGGLASNIGLSQTQIAQDTAEVSSNKIGTDLASYGASAGTLTAVNSVNSRLTSYINNAQSLSSKLDVQNQALSTVATAAQSAQSAVEEAIANNSGDALITTLQAQLTTATGALNTQYGGQYLFSGGQANTAPVTATQLSDLTSASPLSSVFTNGQLQQSSRLDDTTVVQTGVLASSVATPLYTALQQVQAYNAGPNGPLSGTLTDAQSSFLSGVLSQFSAATSSANTVVADNGVVQQEVSDASTRLSDQQTTIANVVSNLTVPDEAAVASQLTLEQNIYQASAQVFSSLQSDSLLQVINPSSTG